MSRELEQDPICFEASIDSLVNYLERLNHATFSYSVKANNKDEIERIDQQLNHLASGERFILQVSCPNLTAHPRMSEETLHRIKIKLPNSSTLSASSAAGSPIPSRTPTEENLRLKRQI